MIIEVKMFKDKKSTWWLAEVPFLDLITQAETKEGLPEMVKDALESLINEPGFEVIVSCSSDDRFYIDSNNAKLLAALALKRQRAKMGLTQEEVANRLHAKSKNEYAQYEQAKSMPSLEQLEKLLAAIDPTLKAYVSVSNDAHCDEDGAVADPSA